MSDPVGVTVHIGGTLPADHIEAFLECVSNDIDNLQGQYTREELEAISGKSAARFDGTANYGICDEITDFCEKHDMPYTISAEACGGYDSDITFWVPGMEEKESYKTDSVNNVVVRVDAIKPLTDLMSALITQDRKALALFLNDPATHDLVSVGLNTPAEFGEALRKSLDEILPGKIPDIPPLVIA